MGKTRDLFRKIRDTKETFHAKMVSVKDRNGTDLIDRLLDEVWTEVHDIVQRLRSRPSPRKRNAKKQNSCLRRPYK